MLINKHKDEHMQHEEQELTVGPGGEDQWETVFRYIYKFKNTEAYIYRFGL
jgi:hypothetical protein